MHLRTLASEGAAHERRGTLASEGAPHQRDGTLASEGALASGGPLTSDAARSRPPRAQDHPTGHTPSREGAQNASRNGVSTYICARSRNGEERKKSSGSVVLRRFQQLARMRAATVGLPQPGQHPGQLGDPVVVGQPPDPAGSLGALTVHH